MPRPCHIAGRSCLAREGAGQAQIGEFGLSFERNQHVARLHVAVNQPPLVGVCQASGDLRNDAPGCLHAQRTELPDQLAQVAAGDELGDEVVHVSVMARVECPHQVLVVQARLGTDLASKPGDGLGRGSISGEHLDGNFPSKHIVLSPEQPGPSPPDRASRRSGRARDGIGFGLRAVVSPATDSARPSSTNLSANCRASVESPSSGPSPDDQQSAAAASSSCRRVSNWLANATRSNSDLRAILTGSDMISFDRQPQLLNFPLVTLPRKRPKRQGFGPRKGGPITTTLTRK